MILALDPSLNKTGYCIMDSQTGAIMESGVLRTDRDASVIGKQSELEAKLEAILRRMTPKAWRFAIVEIPASHAYRRTQGRGGQITNLDALLKLFRAIGVLTITLSRSKFKIYEVTPQTWKGNRKKVWDQMEAERILGRRVINDESDAIALADFGRRIYGRQ